MLNSTLGEEVAIHEKESQAIAIIPNEFLVWLPDMADGQAKDIGSYVVVEQLRFCFHDFSALIPILIFAIDIRNKSFFEITIDDKIEQLLLGSDRLNGCRRNGTDTG